MIDFTEIRKVVGSSRPVSWVNTAFPFAAAYIMAGGGNIPVLVVATLYFLIPYNLLMYGVNDVFDYESDLRNPRKGGIEGIVLDREHHALTLWAAALTNVPFLVALIAWGSAASTAVLAVSVFAVIAYSAPVLRFKERPVLDSVTSSTHFVSPAVFGLALTGSAPGTTAILTLTAFFLWGMASHAFGAVQDIESDRAAGIGSVAASFGAKKTVRGAALLYALAAAVLLFTEWPVLLAALLAVPYIANVAPYWNLADADCEAANLGWRRFIWLNLVTGFFVTQLLIWISFQG